MNTASRMESNGIGGRIHVSQQTADELIAKGRVNWLVPREDKIIAKGKGEMHTYWVEIRTAKSCTTASSFISRYSRSSGREDTTMNSGGNDDAGEENSASLTTDDDELKGRVSRLGAASLTSSPKAAAAAAQPITQ